MTRFLVTGASGFIGRHLVRALDERPGNSVAALCRRQPTVTLRQGRWRPVDLTAPDAVRRVFEDEKPEVVIHLAAMSNVDAAERDPGLARMVNVDVTARIADLTHAVGARIVFLSSDFVFHGDSGPYAETAQPAPTTVYGATKLQAEGEVQARARRWAVARTSLVYGPRDPDVHGNIVTAVRDAVLSGNRFQAHRDVHRSPVYVTDVVSALMALADRADNGVFHIAGHEWMDMCSFAVLVADAFGLDKRLIGCVDQREQAGTAGGRPALLGLDGAETRRRLGLAVRPAMDGLRAMRIAMEQHADKQEEVSIS